MMFTLFEASLLSRITGAPLSDGKSISSSIVCYNLIYMKGSQFSTMLTLLPLLAFSSPPCSRPLMSGDHLFPSCCGSFSGQLQDICLKQRNCPLGLLLFVWLLCIGPEWVVPSSLGRCRLLLYSVILCW